MSRLRGDRIQNGSTLQADVCIVGAGAAGIALARRLAAQRISVLLMESGVERHDAQVQALYAGEIAKPAVHTPAERYRERRLGGSTTIWGGRCVPFDPIDFESRPWMPGTDWPIDYSELARWYEDANELCEAGEFAYDIRSANLRDSAQPIAGFASASISDDTLERASPPTDFWARYGAGLAASASVTVCDRANCVAFELDADGEQIESARFLTLAGTAFRVQARRFVLCAGGLETARLLLASRGRTPAGLGNVHDHVGRHYMCHIAGTIGEVVVATRAYTGYVTSADGVYCRRRFAIRPEVQRAQGLCNLIARLHFPEPSDPAHRTGFLSAAFLVRNLLSFEYRIRLRPPRSLGVADHFAHLRNLVMDGPRTAVQGLQWIAARRFAHRRLPSVVVEPRVARYRIDFHAEQRPLAASRVTLADGVDPLGLRRLYIDWRYASEDIDDVRRGLLLLQAEFARSGTARFDFDPEGVGDAGLREGAYGGHHLGTARMSARPERGVVDPNGRVHECANLYIAGSAVFPSSSQANPTLTIVALALRLGDHLAHLAKAEA